MFELYIPDTAQLLYDNTFTLNNSVYLFFAVKLLIDTVTNIAIKTDKPIFIDGFVIMRSGSVQFSYYQPGIGYPIGSLTGKNNVYYILASAKVV